MNREKLQYLKKTYKGKSIRLLSMDDVQAPPVGTIGKCITVDDAGQLIMRWPHSSLSLIPGIDQFEIVKD